MGFWQGVQQGVEIVKADELNAETMRLASLREDRAARVFERGEAAEKREEYKFLADILGTGGSGVLGLPSMSKGSSSTKSSAKSTKQMMAVLRKIGVGDSQLETLHTSGGTDASTRNNVKQAYDIALKVIDQRDSGSYVTGERSAAELLGEMIVSAVYSKPVDVPLDDTFWKKFQDDYSMVVSEENKERFGSVYVGGGEVDFLNPPVLIEKGSISDILNLQKLAITNVTNQATYDLSNIRTIESTIQGVESSGENIAEFAGPGEGEDIAQTNLNFIKDFLSTRTSLILDAQNNFTDNQNPNDLYSIYGTNYIEMLKKERPEVQTDLLGGDFQPQTQVPMNVGNMFTYQYLYRLGILKDGMVVTLVGPDGNQATTTVGMGEE